METAPSQLSSKQYDSPSPIYWRNFQLIVSETIVGVRRLGTLQARFNAKLWDELPQQVNSNREPYRALKYQLQMKVSGANLDWSIIVGSVELGRVSIVINPVLS